MPKNTKSVKRFVTSAVGYVKSLGRDLTPDRYADYLEAVTAEIAEELQLAREDEARGRNK